MIDYSSYNMWVMRAFFFLQYKPPVELDEFYNLCFYNPNMSLLHAKICYCWPCGFKKIELEKKVNR